MDQETGSISTDTRLPSNQEELDHVPENIDNPSIHSPTAGASADVCRICWDGGDEESLIRPCNCEGTGAHIHLSCLEEWLSVNQAGYCVVCQAPYNLPARSHYRRWLRVSVRWLRFICGISMGFILMVAIFARPFGFIMWFAFSASATDPFDSPMFLYLLKAKETWNDIESDVDAALALDSAPLVDRLVATSWVGHGLSCEEMRGVAKVKRWVRPRQQTGVFWKAMESEHGDDCNRDISQYINNSVGVIKTDNSVVKSNSWSINPNFLRSITKSISPMNKTTIMSTFSNFDHMDFPILSDLVDQFLNATCGRHSLFKSISALRYCECGDSKQSFMRVQLTKILHHALASLNCTAVAERLLHNQMATSHVHARSSGARMRSGSGLGNSSANHSHSSHADDGATFLDRLLGYNVVSIRTLMDSLLPFVYPRFRSGLVFIKYSPRKINWALEMWNPRFYGIPLSVRNESVARDFAIKSLDFHFCITLICGIFIDVFLFLRLWYAGMSPFLEPPWSSQGDHDGGSGSGGGGGSGESWKVWISGVVQNTKTQIQEQWDTLVVLSVVNYEVAKAWWGGSDWWSLACDLGSFLVFVGMMLALYSYTMMLVSVVVLKTFELDVLTYQ